MPKNRNTTITARALIWGLVLFVVQAHAQRPYFNQVYPGDLGSYNIEYSNSYLYIASSYIDLDILYQGLRMLKLDMVGYTVDTLSLLKGEGLHYPAPKNAFKIFGQEFYLAHSFIDSMGQTEFIESFDNNLNILEAYNLELDLNEFNFNFYSLCIVNGLNNFYIGGSRFTTPGTYVGLLINFNRDTLVNKSQYLPRPGTFNSVRQIENSNDKGLLLCIVERRNLPMEVLRDPILIRTDSTGAVLWQKNLGGHRDDGTLIARYLDDTTIVVAFSKGMYEDTVFRSGQGDISFPRNKIMLVKLHDATGEILDTVTHTMDELVLAVENMIVDKGEIVVVGHFYDYYKKFPGGAIVGLISKFDRELNPKWNRQYSFHKRTDNPADRNYLYDITRTPTGYSAVGIFWASDTNITGRFGDHLWAIGVDTLGCPDLDCAQKAIVPKPPTVELYELRVFPNPGNAQVTVTAPHLPTADIHVCDMQGRLLIRGKLENGRTELETAYLSPGSYLVQAWQGGTLKATEKLMILR